MHRGVGGICERFNTHKSRHEDFFLFLKYFFIFLFTRTQKFDYDEIENITKNRNIYKEIQKKEK
jgi:hypothetical protein